MIKYFIINKKNKITSPYWAFDSLSDIRKHLRITIRKFSREYGNNYYDLNIDGMQGYGFNQILSMCNYYNDYKIVKVDLGDFDPNHQFGYGLFVGTNVIPDAKIIKEKNLWLETIKIGGVKILWNKIRKIDNVGLIFELKSKNPMVKDLVNFYIKYGDGNGKIRKNKI